MSNIVLHRLEVITVRTVQINEKTYCVAKDATDALGYVNSSDAIGAHCKGVAKRYPLQIKAGMQANQKQGASA